jgi:membrane-bound metal-dependent hydrolase YbcI (DUF457 family)
LPFTPFHFGPGTLVKAIAPKWFSLRIFILAQIIIDTETAWNIFQGSERLHTFLHSFVGAPVAILLALFAAYCYNVISLRLLKGRFCNSPLSAPFTTRSTLIAATIGAVSHVFLDSIMHADMTPLDPISTLNPWLQMISTVDLHLVCLGGFVLAALVLGLNEGVQVLLRTRKKSR